MAPTAQNTTTSGKDSVTAQASHEQATGPAQGVSWAWEPAAPSEIPSDPAPTARDRRMSELEYALRQKPVPDDYLNLILIGIAGLSLAIFLTRPRR
jgi:hypothetical protein